LLSLSERNENIFESYVIKFVKEKNRGEGNEEEITITI
jgi:hypothetical protein